MASGGVNTLCVGPRQSTAIIREYHYAIKRAKSEGLRHLSQEDTIHITCYGIPSVAFHITNPHSQNTGRNYLSSCLDPTITTTRSVWYLTHSYASEGNMCWSWEAQQHKRC